MRKKDIFVVSNPHLFISIPPDLCVITRQRNLQTDQDEQRKPGHILAEAEQAPYTLTLQLFACGRWAQHPGIGAYSHHSSESRRFWIMTMFFYAGRGSRESNEVRSMKAWDASCCSRGDTSHMLGQKPGHALFSALLQNNTATTLPRYRPSLSSIWVLHHRTSVYLWNRFTKDTLGAFLNIAVCSFCKLSTAKGDMET